MIPGENIFSYHTAFTYNARIYDPSYGLCYGLTTEALDNFAANVLDMGDIDLVDIYALDNSLMQYVDQIEVGGTMIVTLKGYGLVYEATLADPDSSDFRFVEK